MLMEMRGRQSGRNKVVDAEYLLKPPTNQPTTKLLHKITTKQKQVMCFYKLMNKAFGHCP